MSGDKFTRDEEMKLIELVSRYKCLYDASHADYKNIVIKDNIWRKIASQIEIKTGKNKFIILFLFIFYYKLCF